MERVNAIQTTDGKLFMDEGEATAHQAQLDFAAWYENNQLYGIYEGSRVETRVMLEWLQENREQVLALLTAKA